MTEIAISLPQRMRASSNIQANANIYIIIFCIIYIGVYMDPILRRPLAYGSCCYSTVYESLCKHTPLSHGVLSSVM